ncbi:MAG: hypothetical protein IJB74_10265 [Clostridia bacterium]|nr:hypothetical protein [Clostridia bacterium]
MLNKFRQFMYGRYGGNDALNVFLIILGAVVTLVLSLFFYRTPFTRLIGLIPYGIALFRALSKNYEARIKENRNFLNFAEPWIAFIKKKINQYKDKEHKYYACPQCHRTLRVPKGRGKIKINCPHCGKEFVKKT